MNFFVMYAQPDSKHTVVPEQREAIAILQGTGWHPVVMCDPVGNPDMPDGPHNGAIRNVAETVEFVKRLVPTARFNRLGSRIDTDGPQFSFGYHWYQLVNAAHGRDPDAKAFNLHKFNPSALLEIGLWEDHATEIHRRLARVSGSSYVMHDAEFSWEFIGRPLTDSERWRSLGISGYGGIMAYNFQNFTRSMAKSGIRTPLYMGMNDVWTMPTQAEPFFHYLTAGGKYRQNNAVIPLCAWPTFVRGTKPVTSIWNIEPDDDIHEKWATYGIGNVHLGYNAEGYAGGLLPGRYDADALHALPGDKWTNVNEYSALPMARRLAELAKGDSR